MWSEDKKRFSFVPKTKAICPQCGRKTLSIFLDKFTGEILSTLYGMCDNLNKCGYRRFPWKESSFLDMVELDFSKFVSVPALSIKKVSLPEEVLNGTRGKASKSQFIANLSKYFPSDRLKQMCDSYLLGGITRGDYVGAVTFPYINVRNEIRAIQVVNYDDTNHRTRNTYIHHITRRMLEAQGRAVPAWLTDYESQTLKVDCLFGEHLLSSCNDEVVYLVEAPKTALIGHLTIGGIWLAVGSRGMLNEPRLLPLKGRKVVVIPDEDGVNEWAVKLSSFKGLSHKVFDIRKVLPAGVVSKGDDLADFLGTRWFNFLIDEIKTISSGFSGEGKAGVPASSTGADGAADGRREDGGFHGNSGVVSGSGAADERVGSPQGASSAGSSGGGSCGGGRDDSVGREASSGSVSGDRRGASCRIPVVSEGHRRF
jgi:hypothetical protein